MKKIGWFVDHPVLPAQLKALQDRFGQIEMIVIPGPYRDGNHIRDLVPQHAIDDFVLNAPWSIFVQLTEQQVYPMQAVMDGGRFVRFRRVKGFSLTFEPIKPLSDIHKKIMWVSLFPWLPSQEAELKRLFGNVQIDRYPDAKRPAEVIARDFQRGGYGDLAAVLPLHVMCHLIRPGNISPLWPDMLEVSEGQHEVMARGKFYRFIGFRRVIGYSIQEEEI